MVIPVIEIRGIGPKAAELLRNNGIITAEDLLKDGTNNLQQVPGFSNKRAIQVLNVVATLLGSDDKSSKVKSDKKRTKKKSKTNKKDKEKSGKGKKNNKKKSKNKKKDKKNKKK